MIRLLAGLVAVTMGAGVRDPQAADLVKKLDSADWVEQAQAAKELARMGPPVLQALRPAVNSESPSAKFWASMITEAVLHQSVPPPSLPLPVAPESEGLGNPKVFSPGSDEMGALVFTCTTAAHGTIQATFSRCKSCAKTRRFAADYGGDSFRCTVCKRGYEAKDIVCDKCGQPPVGRTPVRVKAGGP